jgi:hypothetical protein
LNYIGSVIEERRLICQINHASMSCLAEEYKSRNLSDEDFAEEMRDLVAKQTKLFQGDVTISRESDRILADMDNITTDVGKDEKVIGTSLANYFYKMLRGKLPNRVAGQIHWRSQLCKHYNFQPKPHGAVWCPITKCFGPYKSRRAAHIVPYKIGYETMGELFGGNGYELMWSMGNGLPMDSNLEDAFNNYQFCLLPREVAGKPDEWQVVLMDESIRHEFACPGNTWDSYDGTFLEFPDGSDTRPQKRFLYFHYYMCIIKAYKELTPGWKEVREKTRMGRLWSTPGKRRSFALF